MHRSPLHLAARYNHLKVVETLVREGANINSKDYQSKETDINIDGVVSSQWLTIHASETIL